MMPPHKQHRHIRRQRYPSIINILVTIPTLFAIAAYAIPAFTVVAAADIPRGTNAAAPTTPTQIPPTTTATATATYTYTVTKISSTTLTTVSPVPVLHISPHILSLITTVTVTTYEPWPAFPSGPSSGDLAWSSTTTVLEEVVSSVTWVERRRYLERVRGTTGLKGGGGEDGEEETTITNFVVTTENTWVVHPAVGPTTDIFLATGVGVVVGCGGCRSFSTSTSRPTRLIGSSPRPPGGGAARAEERRERGSGSRVEQQMTGGAPGQRAVENLKRDLKPKSQSQQGPGVEDMTWTSEHEAEEEATVVPVAEGEDEDPICKSSNLTTACQGQQCIWKPHAPLHSSSIQGIIITNNTTTTNDTTPKDTPPATATGLETGTYWCLHIHPYHYADSSLRMGRACWGPYLRYRQLNAPCLVGDVGMACLPCVKGGEGEPEPGKKDESWDAVF